MMKEISLNILDIAENSIKAKSTLIEIVVKILPDKDLLVFSVKDNGEGMTKEQIELVEDPFFTTRVTRNVGLGISFLKLAAELAGGRFCIESEKNIGTKVTAEFCLSHINRMPLGNINSTLHLLIVGNEEIDFVYSYFYGEKYFTLDTREFREILQGIPFYLPEVSSFIREYLDENKFEVDNGLKM